MSGDGEEGGVEIRQTGRVELSDGRGDGLVPCLVSVPGGFVGGKMTGDVEAMKTRRAGGGRRWRKMSRRRRGRRRRRRRRRRGRRRGRLGDGVGQEAHNREVIRSDVFENSGGVC